MISDHEIVFACYGIPVGQGAHRVSRHGAIYETSKGHASWRQELVSLAREMMITRNLEMITGPIQVLVTFTFPRLKSHYRTGKYAGLLKPTAPKLHATSPDLDHLQRSLGDALKIAGMIKDDSLICHWSARKIYGDHPGALVKIRLLNEFFDE